MHGVTAAEAPSTTIEDVPMRLKSTFGSAYVTLTGVTQNVALAVLASRKLRARRPGPNRTPGRPTTRFTGSASLKVDAAR